MTDSLALLPHVIRSIAPLSNRAAWTVALTAPMRASGITTPHRIAMFIGQVVEETGNFKELSEDLIYMTSARIMEVWPSHFDTRAVAAQYVGRPQALANRVYANRMGNGNEASGDGWRFRGRGLIQITGRALYTALAKADHRAADPDWLLTLPGASVSACWYWAQPVPHPTLNAMSDAGNVNAVTERINGGLTNLPARKRLVAAAFEALTAPGGSPDSLEA